MLCGLAFALVFRTILSKFRRFQQFFIRNVWNVDPAESYLTEIILLSLLNFSPTEFPNCLISNRVLSLEFFGTLFVQYSLCRVFTNYGFNLFFVCKEMNTPAYLLVKINLYAHLFLFCQVWATVQAADLLLAQLFCFI